MARSSISGKSFLDFLKASSDAFHAVRTCTDALKSQGFEQLDERAKWDLKPNGKYFFTRNETSMLAVVVGGKWAQGNGASIVAAHTDSPTLRIKRVSKRTVGDFQQVAVETYGGGLWHTWFDRDLGISGRILVRQGEKSASCLLKIEEPILRVPSLAIHMDRDQANSFEFNKEEHLPAVITSGLSQASAYGEMPTSFGEPGSKPSAALEKNACSKPFLNPPPIDIDSPASALVVSSEAPKPTAMQLCHHPALLRVIADKLGCKVEEIEAVDLQCIDCQPPAFGGPDKEFVLSGRLDNLAMCFCALTGLLQSAETQEEEKQMRVCVLFDHEEIGSLSAVGARGTVLESFLQRANGSEYHRAISSSFCLSADMVHATHPNHLGRHESRHNVFLNGGVCVKHHCNQKYATTAVSCRLLEKIAESAGLELQHFMIRQDMLSGSTVGPAMAAKLGVRCVDMGLPQLSMHSIREMCGSADIDNGVALCRAFYSGFSSVDGLVVTSDTV